MLIIEGKSAGIVCVVVNAEEVKIEKDGYLSGMKTGIVFPTLKNNLDRIYLIILNGPAGHNLVPMTGLISRDFCYGNIAERQNAYYGGRVFGCELNNPDFAKVAELFGARGFRVHNPEEFEVAMSEAVESGEPCVIDVIEEFGKGGLPAGSKPLVAK